MERICNMRQVSRFNKDESGATLVEYGMLVGLIAVVCLAAVQGLGQEVSSVFSYISGQLIGLV
jgi:pilus assembly protein Flp/PilA